MKPDPTQFSARMAELKASFAGKAPKEDWDAVVTVYFKAFSVYPDAVLVSAIERASDECLWFPTKQELGAILTEEYARHGRNKGRIQKSLPEFTNPEGARRVLESFADEHHERLRDVRWDPKAKQIEREDARATVRRALVLLGASYGLATNGADELPEVRGLVALWSDTGKLTPASAIRGVNLSTSIYETYPTSGQIAAAARGGRAYGPSIRESWARREDGE